MQITLEIPDILYQELLNQAELSNRSVEELLLQKLEGQSENQFSVHPQHAKMRQEVEYFDAHLESLWQEYPNQFVAIHQQQVIDCDMDELALIERVRTVHPAIAILIRKVTGEPVPELRFRRIIYLPERRAGHVL